MENDGNKKGCPEVIYLQACDECFPEIKEFDNMESITWAETPIPHECMADDAMDAAYISVKALAEALGEALTLEPVEICSMGRERAHGERKFKQGLYLTMAYLRKRFPILDEQCDKLS